MGELGLASVLTSCAGRVAGGGLDPGWVEDSQKVCGEQ